MCGVIAYFSPRANAADAASVLRLFLESKVRGRHAFGLAWHDGFELRTLRAHNQAPVVAQVIATVRSSLGSPCVLVGHTRYDTSGDWRTLANNQPLHINNVALAFNGVIDMRTRAEWEAETGERFETENDGEMFIKHLVSGGDPVAFVSARGSFAGCWFEDRRAFVLRNSYRPLWYGVSPSGATLIASTRNILLRAVPSEPIELPAGVLYRLSELADSAPQTNVSQQATLFGAPPNYLSHPRYSPRSGGLNAARPWLL